MRRPVSRKTTSKFCHRTKSTRDGRRGQSSLSPLSTVRNISQKIPVCVLSLHCVDFPKDTYITDRVVPNFDNPPHMTNKCLRVKVFPIFTISLISFDVFFLLSFFFSRPRFLSFSRNPHPLFPESRFLRPGARALTQTLVPFEFVSQPSQPNFFAKPAPGIEFVSGAS